MRSPLFVFPSRPFSQPPERHEVRLFHVINSCLTASGRAVSMKPPQARNANAPDSPTVKQKEGEMK